MKRTILLAVIFALLILPCSAQEQNQIMSDSAKELAEKIKTGDYESILEMGTSGDRTIIPYLKVLASKESKWIVHDNAQMALAKLGEKEYLNQILAEVDAESPDIQDKAMKKLSYVGGKAAFKKFYELLDDNDPRQSESPCIIFFTRSTTAMFFLREMVANPPTTKAGAEYIRIWKEWFDQNKHLID
jgi:HEAT repeat protein